MYSSQEVAEDALIEAWTRFEYAPNQGPVAVYKCEDCGQYHLTSKGTMNEKLSKALAAGKIQRQKEADRWLDKLKRR
jgi:ABC-type ATPase with predicted acetyltransferase domain